MGPTIANLTPHLRRYAHALLGVWPRASSDATPQADQDADDLVHDALLGFWRAGLRRFADSAINAGDALRFALFRRVTMLAREHFTRKAAQILAAGDRIDEVAPSDDASSHFAWAPEARALPRLTLELRGLLALVALERMTYAEAGVVLDMTAEQALARLSVARARLASEISGVARAHLITVSSSRGEGAINEADLHNFVDDRLGLSRRDEVLAFLELHPEAARRTREWKWQSERLRRAFEPLMREPVPPSLDFASPEPGFGAPRRALRTRNNVLRRLTALFAAPAVRVETAPRSL